MTVQPGNVLDDPTQDFWDQAARDPLDVLSDSETSQAEKLIDDSHRASTLVEVSLAIGAAFLFYKMYMARRLRRAVNPSLTAVGLGIANDYYWRQFSPVWMQMAAPALLGAMSSSIDTRTGDVPFELLAQMADSYAQGLGEYVNQTSGEALTEGFQAHLNKKVPVRMAAEKAIEAYGLSTRQMRALNALKPSTPVNSIQVLDLERPRRDYIDTSVVSRAFTIGDNEAWSVSQQGKQVAWLYLQKHGQLPSDTERVWITAHDERVCKVCGPLHHQTVPLDKPFDTPQGPIWTPALHPNCRCEVRLKVPISRELAELSKADSRDHEFDRLHPRGKAGRFRNTPDVPPVKESPFIDPFVADMLRALEQHEAEPEGFVASEGFQVPKGFQARQYEAPKPFVPDEPSGFQAGGVEAEGFSVPGFTAEGFKAALEEFRIERASYLAESPLFTPSTKQPDANGLIPLPNDIQRLDATGNIFYDGDRIEHSEMVVIDDPEQYPFYSVKDTDEMIKVSYDAIIEMKAIEVLARGAYAIKDADTGAIKIRLNKQEIKDAIEAELLGAKGTRGDQLRVTAQALGINREKFVHTVYVLNQTYADAKDKDGYTEVPGPYVVVNVHDVKEKGYPIRRVDLRPMTEDEYDQWEMYMHDGLEDTDPFGNSDS